jgi:hypothetical protein
MMLCRKTDEIFNSQSQTCPRIARTELWESHDCGDEPREYYIHKALCPTTHIEHYAPLNTYIEHYAPLHRGTKVRFIAIVRKTNRFHSLTWSVVRTELPSGKKFNCLHKMASIWRGGKGKNRVARWFIFKPKIPIWVNYLGPYLDWKMLKYFMAIWNILGTFGIVYEHFVHFVLFGIFFPVLVSCTKKNLATLEKKGNWNVDLGIY